MVGMDVSWLRWTWAGFGLLHVGVGTAEHSCSTGIVGRFVAGFLGLQVDLVFARP